MGKTFFLSVNAMASEQRQRCSNRSSPPSGWHPESSITRVQRDFHAGATISARLLRVYLRLSARPRILAGRRIAQARFEPEPCRRASGFAWPAVKSPLQPYGLSPPAKPRMPPEAARECAPAGLHECGPPIFAIMFCLWRQLKNLVGHIP